MKIVHVDDVPVTTRRHHARAGQLQYHRMLTGAVGAPSNFMFILTKLDSDYTTPRHTHNFDQVRLQLEGSLDHGVEGPLTAGMVGYFPEGTPYGPQASSDGCVTLALQFGGASGSGYLSEEQMSASIEKLKKTGEYRDGVYTHRDSQGRKRNQDGYEAAWELCNERPISYPKPRFRQPVLMMPANFDWVPSPDQPGVARKLLGSFGERQTTVGFLALEPRAVARLAENSIYFFLDGRARASSEICVRHTSIHLEHGESVTIEAVEATEVFHIGLPDLRHLDPMHAPRAAAPALEHAIV